MGTYNIPRNVKGEGRILFIFSKKALIYTAIGASVGLLFYLIFLMVNLNLVGIIITLVCALLGFIIGTFKVPELGIFGFTKKVGGENIDDIIKRALLFRKKGKRMFIYTNDTKEEEK